VKELSGKVAVITGAGSGIGASLSTACAAEGMHVVAADVDEAGAAQTVNAIEGQGGKAVAAAVDVRKRESLDALAETTWQAFGGCHLLCNNAGVMVNKPLLELEESDWRWILDVNLMGIVHGLGAFVPRMKEQGGEAHVVNTASMAGLAAFAAMGLGAYTASKFAAVSVSEILSQELEGTDIGVSVLCPGAVVTRIHESARIRPSEMAGTTPSILAGEANPEHVAGAQSPDQIAQTVLRGVRENRLYLITHPEMKPAVEGRFAAISEAFDSAES
jgi:NAD(P)-dependent dehydrogenase (short-subunit alcohol dehydrogenase family)